MAPSPTGLLHLGHARTFWTAQERTRHARGRFVLRVDDLDRQRCAPRFVDAMYEDLAWFGFAWDEGPDRPGGFGPYAQSERRLVYLAAFERLLREGWVYPCRCSRRDVRLALEAPHGEEPIYPGTCRPTAERPVPVATDWRPGIEPTPRATSGQRQVNWRFRTPDRATVTFEDLGCGPQSFVAGRDFGDFVVWRHDDTPSYQLACMVDDAGMGITEVVRGSDLLVSTARQILLYRALHLAVPRFYHCPLVTDERGVRLAKRHDALSLRALREAGRLPEELRQNW